ncbi:MFS multidrug transporter-like protein [Bisporella sp. PMI_857]|nr:MFS multidrug transporter-like protein [Bisporella sp. PMI_857]
MAEALQEESRSQSGETKATHNSNTIIDSENIDGPVERDKNIQTADASDEPQSSIEEKNYSSFSLWEKRFMVFAATMGAFFSPFTAQIYFPALNTIAKDLHVSNSKVNLTITTYMILQAIAPAFIGNFSDNAGRRPAYIVCFVIYIVANVALALQNNYVALLVLRMVQSAGSSGTVALASATVADVATPAERGTYMGITFIAGLLAPAIGPILGGIISQYAGWKWIFWFLAILATIFFIPLVIFMPETGRNIVGDGSIPPPRINRSVVNHFDEKRRAKAGITPDYAERERLAKERRIGFPNPLATLVIAVDKEAACILFFTGIVYAGFYAVIAAMPSQLRSIYGYSDIVIGLMYLPISGGCAFAAFAHGKLIDWSYSREARRLGLTVNKSRGQDLTNFPIEKARLLITIPILLMCVSFIIGYGWILHFETNVAGPCVMLFFMGYTFVASTQSVSILIVDIYPEAPGTATAAFNLIRCLLGAGSSTLIIPMLDAMGSGWAYTLIGLIYVLLSPMLWIVMKWGPGWRKQRMQKETAKNRVKTGKKKENAGSENV